MHIPLEAKSITILPVAEKYINAVFIQGRARHKQGRRMRLTQFVHPTEQSLLTGGYEVLEKIVNLKATSNNLSTTRYRQKRLNLYRNFQRLGACLLYTSRCV